MLSIQKTEVQREKDRLENPPEKVEALQEELELEKIKKEKPEKKKLFGILWNCNIIYISFITGLS